MLLIDGELKGKPADAEQARPLWRQMAGREALLITGHAVRRVIDGRLSAAAADSRSSIVRMGTPTEREVEAYIATGEPLAVAGALDHRRLRRLVRRRRRRRSVQCAGHFAAADQAIARRRRS